jgi:small subunit ribosomal protein S20
MSAIKRARQEKRRNVRNTAVKSRVTTFEKKLTAAIKGKDSKAAQAALVSFMSEIDKAAQKGVVHFKRAARRVSSLSRQVATLSAR